MTELKNIRAVGLVSGGLDSILAVRLIMDQGIEVIGLHMVSPFTVEAGPAGPKENIVEKQARENGFIYRPLYLDSDYIEVIRNPRYGYGAHINPCVDCHIYFLRKAAEVMEEEGAQFVFTGEVISQRPMSQTRPMLQLIEKQSSLKGYLLRPLSALKLEPTIPEKLGWVKRDLLLDIYGRSRSRQMELARHYGITHFQAPAGGCLLTDPHYSRRLECLFSCGFHDMNSIHLLQAGRTLNLAPGALLIVGRNEEDNNILANLASENDILLEAEGGGSPLCILRGPADDALISLAAAITRRFSRMRDDPAVAVMVRRCDTGEVNTITPPLIAPDETKQYIIQ